MRLGPFVIERARSTEPVVEKAASGTGVAFWDYDLPLTSLSRSPQKLMREAQALYRTNPWIRSAENAVTRRVVGVNWHIEDETDEEVQDTTGNPRLKPVQTLMEKPQEFADVGRKMTRSQLWSITSRHMGLCGVAYWYLDGLDAARVPTSILYVNPARIWPSVTANGNLIGWVLDAQDEQGNGGTPLRLEELVPFYLEEPDENYAPIGLVQAAALKARITTAGDAYSAQIFSKGGRLGGFLAPKAGAIPNEDYKQLVQDMRNITEQQDYKRLAILRGPMDYTETAADPTKLALKDVLTMNRDDIFAVWGVPPTQAGVPQKAGLNSGETKAYDYQILMQGPVHDRLTVLRETVQFQILDRYQSIGLAPELILEEPSFDDSKPQYEIAKLALEQPLTFNDRRALLELDPLPDYGPDGSPLGLAIYLPVNLVSVGQGPEDNGGFDNAPQPEPTPPPPRSAPFGQPTALGPEVAPETGKASISSVRSKLLAKYEPLIRRAVAAFLAEQRTDISARVRDKATHLAKKPTDVDAWWTGAKWNKRLTELLRGHATGLASTALERVQSVVGAHGKADGLDRVTQVILDEVGRRVTNINDTTRDAIRAVIEQGIEDELTADELADAVSEATAFDEARAELIARTESGYVYNRAAVESYRSYDVGQVSVIDGDGDDICAAANGAVWTLEEAEADPLGHPNCTRDFLPLYAEAA